jgi:hypothetical protein
VVATVPVTPGETLTLEVAQGGASAGDGGGATSVLRGTTVLVIAGGGGGGGSDGNSGNSFGGGAGGAAGILGEDGQGLLLVPGYAYCTAADGGGGASQTQGGRGGNYVGTASYPCRGQDGSALAGGSSNGVFGSCNTQAGAAGWHSGGGQANGGGGAGGAGWFGGGGAGFIWTYCGGGGGGGSSAGAPGVLTTVFPGVGSLQGLDAASSGAGAGGTRAYNRATMAYDASLGHGGDGRIEVGP